jgi:large subunit ribosomal protein L17
MRHRVAHRKLGRVTEHRIAMLRNQASALLKYEHLTTTVPRAKELRPFVERLITIAKRGVAGGEKNGHALTARRLVMQDLQDREVVSKLFDTLAPRFASRPGGYTRLLRIGFRRGDSAEVAQVELVGSEYSPKTAEERKAEKEGAAAPKSRSVGDRLRSAARGLRGGAKGEQGGSKGQAGGQTRGKAQKSTTPRKAGGS